MARGNSKMESHEFYCTVCGNRGIPIVRAKDNKRARGHLKKLYCLSCETDTNHYEVSSPYDYENFIRDFNLGKWGTSG